MFSWFTCWLRLFHLLHVDEEEQMRSVQELIAGEQGSDHELNHLHFNGNVLNSRGL
jgi:hypothetical protein